MDLYRLMLGNFETCQLSSERDLKSWWATLPKRKQSVLRPMAIARLVAKMSIRDYTEPQPEASALVDEEGEGSVEVEDSEKLKNEASKKVSEEKQEPREKLDDGLRHKLLLEGVQVKPGWQEQASYLGT